MTLVRPFPAVVFQNVPVAATPVLPRMDVAAFVGFASSGPLHTPVAVEDPAELQEVFGEAPVLAWDAVARVWQRASLGPAVEDFFAQAGRRCWVVRVAGAAAATNSFAVPGLVRVTEDGTRPALTQAKAPARSPGSWSDGLQVAATLQRDPFILHEGTLAEVHASPRLSLVIAPVRGRGPEAGDLLHVTFDGPAATTAYVAVDAVEPVDSRDDGRFRRIQGRAYWLEPLPIGADVAGRLVFDETPAAGEQSLRRLSEADIELAGLPDDVAVSPGELLCLRPSTGGHDYYLVAGEQRGSVLTVRAAYRYGPPPGSVGRPWLVSRVSMGLSARESNDRPGRRPRAWSIDDLGFAPDHLRYWDWLPADTALYADSGSPPQGTSWSALGEEARRPRFPLSGSDSGATFLPLGLEGTPVAWGPSDPRPEDALVRDGLVPAPGESWTAFMRSLFLDPRLGGLEELLLIPEFTDLRYRAIRQDGGEPLRGVHALMHLEEVSIVALPDASAAGWRLVPAEVPEPEETNGDTEPVVEPPCPGHDLFVPCEDVAPPAEPPAPPPAPFSTPAPERWALIEPDAYDTEGLLSIHRAALRMASARADMLALLGLPLHFDAAGSIAYRRLLMDDPGSTELTPSFGALYHAWYHARGSDGRLRRTSPEGAVAGIMAARANARGAWVAPANEVVRPALALTLRTTPEERDLLYEAGINQLVASARGFLLMGADTLATDRELQPIGVRRLLTLLRRLAFQEGRTYAFEPNSPAFRRRVNVAFQRVLQELFKLGAFAGRDPGEAFQVNTGDSVNTREGIEAGRFVVELKVAPSQPMTFITVRLVQNGPDTLTLVEAR